MVKRLASLQFILALLVLTFLTLALYHWLPEKRIEIDAQTAFDMRAVDDREIGGQSRASLTRDDQALVMHCDIDNTAYQYPFCELSIDFRTDEVTGLDLSGMERVELSAKYVGSNKNWGIRFHLRNFSPVISKPLDFTSLKYVGLEYFGKASGETVKFPVNSLQVPTWWLVENAMPVEHMGPEIDNVHLLQITTGTDIAPGQYELHVGKITFIGKYIAKETVYFALLTLWIASAMAYLLAQLYRYKRWLKKAKNRRHELEAVNRILDYQRKTLEEKLDKDPLTGALNREGIYKIFNSETDLGAGSSLSIMFLDLDKFKAINDTYGHNVGDEVLVLFSELVRGNTRDSDVLARWGGEEFILACPNTSLNNAQRVANSLCEKIRAKQWPQNIPLTCSIGVAQMGDETVESLIDRADTALYKAKSSGRDKVVVSTLGE